MAAAITAFAAPQASAWTVLDANNERCVPGESLLWPTPYALERSGRSNGVQVETKVYRRKSDGEVFAVEVHVPLPEGEKTALYFRDPAICAGALAALLRDTGTKRELQ